jgi:peptidoglycan/xylan/chitin deacetylase (PgdA/CDA1 family)
MSPTLLAICACLLLGVLHVVVPRLVLQARRRKLLVACRSKRAIVLTFDDGPSRVLTPLVVERLTRAGVPGTFFVLGERLAGNEHTVKDMLAHGHELGSHGSTHVHHIWSWPWDGVLDTQDGWEAVRATTGRSPQEVPFRPPYGKLNLLSLAWVWWHRASIAMWTHDGGDTRDYDNLAPMALVDAVRRDGGGVVLMHDFDRSMPDEGQQVLAKLDAVLQLKREGFSFLRITDVLRPTG